MRLKNSIHGISPKVDVALAEMNEMDEWLALNKDTAPSNEVAVHKAKLLQKIKEVNDLLAQHEKETVSNQLNKI